MDVETIKKMIAVIDERIRAHSEQMKALSGMIAEDVHLKDNFTAKLKRAESESKE